MNFIVDPRVLALGVKIRGVELTGVDNHAYPQALKEMIANEIRQVLTTLDRDQIKTDPVIQGFWDLHRAVHLPKRNNTPAPATLLKLILKRGELAPINPVVDLYNLISIQSHLALGAHDVDRIDGNVNLRLTTGTEKFIPIGANGQPEPVKAGEYAYIDDSNEIICHLETRQVEKTKVTAETNHLYYIVQGNQQTSQEFVDQTAERVIALTTKYLGGQGKLLN
ncbi:MULTISPECIES: B3/4 domain-containing protein [Lacticaseibacillus]|uniref:tRNA ligase n=2 Tax=Lacticaseibacillus TaxID=2759736 RepID=A0AAN1KF25_LACCA|nr:MULTISPECIES: phenylalanine--tRNA ligase beta subunit-related protein [Lacticaseibacillus]ARY92393.1 tRNA ligase [Lacticaseibacillus casei]KAB1971438.1 tRNA ligase [Lacticaseibacillus casei]WLV80291.1 phenylalanine--tRNA ligase beta subunit-related protein [Lacticaseibacillus sp. NCIMB 15473]WNX24250.1 phenylalanine--tRNA ligase beta subunit-related protein [Lacticaseibacillus casei]WNX27024.1 phenylalanine--tRNA ligase beta subunit-related protein [Lacticaseibacillus casei]